MRSLALLLPLFVAVISSASSACSSAAVTEERLCTPNNNVFCRCTDLREGTKRCSEDGMAFGECDCGDIPPPPPDPPDAEVIDAGPDAPPTGPEADVCPGAAYAVDPTKATVITGNTATATADYVSPSGACAAATSKDHVYQIIPTGSGALTATMKGSGAMDATLYVREADCATGKQLACGATTGAGGTETVSINVLTGKPYYVFADSAAGTEGEYTLELSLKTGPFCGDNKVDKDEGCDDGNKTSSDGCGNNCVPEGDPASAGTCPGMTAHVWPGKTLNFAGTTQGYTSSASSTQCTFGTGAEDRVYAVTAHGSGNLTIELDAQFDGGLQARKTCASSAELGCVNAVTGAGKEKLTIAVTSGIVYYVFVDGSATGQRGSFTLTLKLP